MYNTWKVKNIEIFWNENIDGSGRSMWFNFYRILRNKGRVNDLLELGSGPGFIGYSLLDLDYCNNLFLTDINENACKACKKTNEHNNLNNVNIVCCDAFNGIEKQFDVIVCNPPFDSNPNPKPKKLNYQKEIQENLYIFSDPNLNLNVELLNKFPYYLKKDGWFLIYGRNNLLETLENRIQTTNYLIDKVKFNQSRSIFVFQLPG